MPWVKQEDCTGCGTCVEECPVEAISLIDEHAQIDMEECIRCGRCHDVCPEEAIRHDSEKIPEEVKANIEKAKRMMDACARYFGNEEKQKCLNRIIKYFNKERVVIEKTLEKLKSLQ